MIDPNATATIDVDGQTFEVRVMTRRQLRELTHLIGQVSQLDEDFSSMDRMFDALDSMTQLCLPKMDEAKKELLSVDEVLSIAGEVIAQQIAGDATKKKYAP